MKCSQSSIMAVVLIAAGWTSVARASTTFGGSVVPSTQAEKPRKATGSSHHIYGRIRSIEGPRLTVETRTGQLVQVDAASAIQAHLSVVPVVGHAVEVRGTSDTKGVLHAETILRAKESPAVWPADR